MAILNGKKAIIIGAGRTGTALAPMLEADGISVKVIDLDPEQCRHSGPGYRRVC